MFSPSLLYSVFHRNSCPFPAKVVVCTLGAVAFKRIASSGLPSSDIGSTLIDGRHSLSGKVRSPELVKMPDGFARLWPAHSAQGSYGESLSLHCGLGSTSLWTYAARDADKKHSKWLLFVTLSCPHCSSPQSLAGQGLAHLSSWLLTP